MKRIAFWSILFLTCACRSAVVIYDTNVTVQTFAGSGFPGLVNGVGVETMFHTPYAICIDSKSNLFVTDFNNGCIRKITPDATVTTFVTQGGGRMAIDRDDNIWFGGGGLLAKVNPAGVVTTTNIGLFIDYRDGFACDSFNNIYFVTGERIWRFKTNGLLEVFAGSGSIGHQDGTGIFTSFNNPQGLAFDQADNLFVADSDNHLVRKITPNQVVTTYAGFLAGDYVDGSVTNASFGYLNGIAVDTAGNVFVVGEWSVRRISPQGMVTTVAGGPNGGYQNGPGDVARFRGAVNLAVSRSGEIFVPDRADERIRKITAPQTVQISASQLTLRTYAGITVTGIVGRAYRIESSTLANTNWFPETVLVLPSSPYLWIDTTPFGTRKFYRAFLLP